MGLNTDYIEIHVHSTYKKYTDSSSGTRIYWTRFDTNCSYSQVYSRRYELNFHKRSVWNGGVGVKPLRISIQK